MLSSSWRETSLAGYGNGTGRKLLSSTGKVQATQTHTVCEDRYNIKLLWSSFYFEAAHTEQGPHLEQEDLEGALQCQALVLRSILGDGERNAHSPPVLPRASQGPASQKSPGTLCLVPSCSSWHWCVVVKSLSISEFLIWVHLSHVCLASWASASLRVGQHHWRPS